MLHVMPCEHKTLDFRNNAHHECEPLEVLSTLPLSLCCLVVCFNQDTLLAPIQHYDVVHEKIHLSIASPRECLPALVSFPLYFA
jgi:hypothetical protein